MKINHLFLLVPLFGFGQNLVLNPSFEQTAFCPKGIGQFRKNVAQWSIPTYGTSDIFSDCGQGEAAVPSNVFGFQEAKFGHNYAGLYLIIAGDQREYAQGQLSVPLQQGKRYTISLWTSLAERSDYAVNSFAVLFTEKIVHIKSNAFITPSAVSAAEAGNHQLVAVPHSGFISDKQHWTRIEATFTAIGNEHYFSIGNFKSNEATTKKFVQSESDATAYYYIDMVSVEEERQTQTSDLEADITYTLPVSFHFDSAEITPEAQAKLQQIISFLTSNPQSRIRLSGHTDDSGSEDYNQQISLKRSKSVANYLIENGIEASRVETLGLGETQPISDNATEDGRSLNRRVEFILID